MENLFPNDCKECVVSKWCTLRTGEVKLPEDYLSDRCNSKIALYRQLDLCNIPPEYFHANLKHFEKNENNSNQYEQIVNLASRIKEIVLDKKINILLFHPKRGVGKTYTSLVFLNQFIYKTCLSHMNDFTNPLGYYIKFGEWANNIRKMYQINDTTFSKDIYFEIEKMKEVPFLVIDEIGSGRITDIIVDLFYDIVDHRKEYNLSTVYTSNLSVDQLAKNELLGDRIVSRMKYNAVNITLGGSDLRSKK